VKEGGFNKTLRRMLRRALRLDEKPEKQFVFGRKELLMDDTEKNEGMKGRISG
jgi:hypothetical protein